MERWNSCEAEFCISAPPGVAWISTLRASLAFRERRTSPRSSSEFTVSFKVAGLRFSRRARAESVVPSPGTALSVMNWVALKPAW